MSQSIAVSEATEVPVCGAPKVSPEVAKLVEQTKTSHARARAVVQHPVCRQFFDLLRTVGDTAEMMGTLLSTHGVKCRCRFCKYMRDDVYYAEDVWNDMKLLQHTMQMIGSMVETNFPTLLINSNEDEDE